MLDRAGIAYYNEIEPKDHWYDGSKGGDSLNTEEFSKPVVACFARFCIVDNN